MERLERQLAPVEAFQQGAKEIAHIQFCSDRYCSKSSTEKCEAWTVNKMQLTFIFHLPVKLYSPM